MIYVGQTRRSPDYKSFDCGTWLIKLGKLSLGFRFLSERRLNLYGRLWGNFDVWTARSAEWKFWRPGCGCSKSQYWIETYQRQQGGGGVLCFSRSQPKVQFNVHSVRTLSLNQDMINFMPTVWCSCPEMYDPSTYLVYKLNLHNIWIFLLLNTFLEVLPRSAAKSGKRIYIIRISKFQKYLHKTSKTKSEG